MSQRGAVALSRGAATLGRLLLLAAWSGAASLGLLLSPWLGALAVLSLTLAFLYFFAWRPALRGQTRKLAALQLRPVPGAAWRWLWLCVPAMLLFNAGFLALYVPLAGPPPEATRWFQELMERPGGWALGLSLALGSAPVMEEFVFRGWLLRYWRRPLGGIGALLLSAVLFGSFHFSFYTLIFHSCLGLIFGMAALATGSLWAAVFLHFMHNATVALLGPLFLLAEELRATTLALGLLALAAGAVALLTLAKRLREAAAQQRCLRAGAAARHVPEPGRKVREELI